MEIGMDDDDTIRLLISEHIKAMRWKSERRPAAGFSVELKMVGEILRRPTSPVD
jgi:hypothetical protein